VWNRRDRTDGGHCIFQLSRNPSPSYAKRQRDPLSGNLSASVENVADDVISRRNDSEADDSTEESKDRDLDPAVYRRRRSKVAANSSTSEN
jgi:hypothetical protein